MDEINATGQLVITLDGVEETLEKDDLLIDMAQMEGYVSDSDHGITVVLDTNLTDELVEEGFVLEVISKIQTMRKDADFEVMDHIEVSVAGNDHIQSVMEKNKDSIMSKVLCDNLVYGATDGFVKEWNINGENVTLGVKKVN